MQTLELSKYRRARVWLGEALPAEFRPTFTIERTVRPIVRRQFVRRSAALEVCIPRGVVTSYALLGAELIDAEAGGLEVIVGVNAVGDTYAPALASKVDEVRTGMLEEYADAVAEGVARTAESVGAPTNAALRFGWAAHATVGSSRAIFEKASGVLLQLFTISTNDVSRDWLDALLDKN